MFDMPRTGHCFCQLQRHVYNITYVNWKIIEIYTTMNCINVKNKVQRHCQHMHCKNLNIKTTLTLFHWKITCTTCKCRSNMWMLRTRSLQQQKLAVMKRNKSYTKVKYKQTSVKAHNSTASNLLNEVRISAIAGWSHCVISVPWLKVQHKKTKPFRTCSWWQYRDINCPLLY